MCMAKTPKPPAPAVPIPEETAQAAVVDTADSRNRIRRSGRSRLTIPIQAPSSGGASGLNIPR